MTGNWFGIFKLKKIAIPTIIPNIANTDIRNSIMGFDFTLNNCKVEITIEEGKRRPKAEVNSSPHNNKIGVPKTRSPTPRID